MPSNDHFTRVQQAGAVIGRPLRLQLLYLLARHGPTQGAWTQGDLANRLDVTRPTINRSLSALRKAGLIQVGAHASPGGPSLTFTADRAAVQRLLRDLSEVLPPSRRQR